ncbi:hypothetical protein HW090_09690 [Pseudomonas sp. ABC1]|uniref:hypothetical protein n=1 Tax=Pseudomonas sp. ABC1 TaxID=2748080 RepID=UPI0015C39A83|nr:hypothetical protein [Pseudomonas sp. ABC1]QLF93454.1 hypothetical protein HW090_09690 [Pseudomonas sp. ABC1]
MGEKDGSPALSRRGCLGLLLIGLAFIVLVYTVIIYIMTKPQDEVTEANERQAIELCWQRAEDTERSFTRDSCKEMEKQFKRKFGREP